MFIEKSWLIGNTRIRVWAARYWSFHYFVDDGRKCLGLGPVEIYWGE